MRLPLALEKRLPSGDGARSTHEISDLHRRRRADLRARSRDAFGRDVRARSAGRPPSMRYLNDVLTLRPLESAPAIGAPTLFVVGGLDAVATPESSLKAAARMQDARVLEIASAGHYPFLTHPSVFNAGLIDFLGSVES